MLKFSGVTKQYGDFFALHDFSAELDTGIYALLGPNGAGKSTLMELLVGLLRPTAGEITYEGENICAMGERFRAMLGFMPQTAGFYPEFTARMLLQYLGEMKGLDRKTAKHRAAEMLDAVHLSEAADKRIGTFSGGMRQRVGLAQALLNDPKILILDEPTTGLDPKERIRFRNLIRSLARDKTVIFCTHIVSDIESIAQEVLLLHHGKLLARNTVKALTDELCGHIWEIEAPDEKVEALMAQYPKSSLVNRSGIQMLRVITEEALPAAVGCTPTLEDMYLDRFGEDTP